MYLSKLEVFGLKSFAHKVQFEFNDGITSIIGPNGCGKSNIVDAIRWVLGEQRPSLLRLDRMENIIFNGTATRKPLSMAEVSMTIENTRNILPSVYSEVKITRRLYRSGDSEYLLNNKQVRLKDVIDLFTDTGMGSDAYSVIELKMVEQILSDNAEERRRLFEEAAGIKKYKFRRKSALRKLEATEQELLRLNDVLAEVQKTVNSLSRQVGKARRYHQYRDQIRQLELYAFHLRGTAYQQDLKPLREEQEQVRQTRERLGTEINQGEAEMEKLQAKSVHLETRFREVAGRLNSADERIRDRQEQVRLNEQKVQSLDQNVQTSLSEIEDQKNRIADFRRQVKEIGRERETTRQAADEKNEKYKQEANAQLEAEEKLEAVRRRLQQFRAENLNILQSVIGHREEFQRITLQIAGSEEQQEHLAGMEQSLARERQEKEDALASLEEELQIAREEAEQYEKELLLLRSQSEELEKEQQELVSEKNRLLGAIEKKRSQKEFLENLIQNYSGFSEGVQYVMSHREEFNGLVDTLANMVDTAEEYRPALESYLAGIANYLVVEEVGTARSILDNIRRQKKGRLTLVPLSILNPQPNGAPAPEELNGEGRRLKDVVEYDPRFSGLFDFLFDRVLLVEDMETALRWRSRFPDCHFLTRGGELLGDWGAITGGDSRQAMNLTGRRRQFEEAQKKLAGQQARLQEVEKRLKANHDSMEQKKKKQAEFETLLREQQQAVNRLEQQANQQGYEQKRAAERLAEIRTERESAALKIEELQAQATVLRPAVEEANRRQQAFREEEAKLNGELEEADRGYRELSRRVQQLQIEYLQQQARLKELDQKEEYVNQALQAAREQIARLERQIETYQTSAEQIGMESSDIRRQLDGLYANRDVIEKEKLEVENNYQSLKSLILAREEEVKKLHRLWNQSGDRLKEIELRIQEIEIKQQTQREQMEEKYGEELEELLAANPAPEDASPQQLQDQIAELRRKLEMLGEVNPLAVKEYDKEKERLDFLKSQLADLLDAKSELLETISKLNKTARKLFLETFEKIHTNFRSVFGKFFEGGEAELQMVDSADPLDTNIDISVRIKGRKLSTLSLMSAGEKTLTAISLLFAIYLVKPSPFCILDEVDAPLDDVNVARFTHALGEFSDNTQFILVTHNKMTMQAAQAIYGITMEEPGVSKVVSVRFD